MRRRRQTAPPTPARGSEVNAVAIIGAGAYGTALASAARRAGRDVVLCARTPAAAELMRATGVNPRLPGIPIEAGVTVIGDPSIVSAADIVLIAVPSQHLREAMQGIAPDLRDGTPVVACAKGIERGTHCFMTQIIAQVAPRSVPAIMSGPNFADDVARGLPTAVTLACADEGVAIALVRALGSATFRPYHSTDVRGVELGGAAKNVLAIAVGIAVGRALGASAQAALTTRGFSEIMQLGLALGAQPQTLAGLSGLGDLILTCGSPQSRNFALGYALGRGEPPDRGKLAEGAATAPVLLDLAAQAQVEMPIAAAVAAVLAGTLDVNGAIDALLTRPFRAEG
jgi:glycerol-3-phosphate dehydrogenase (NAD(P)+)